MQTDKLAQKYQFKYFTFREKITSKKRIQHVMLFVNHQAINDRLALMKSMVFLYPLREYKRIEEEEKVFYAEIKDDWHFRIKR